MKFLSVGHITQDRIEGRSQFGGSALYGARVAAKLGFRSAVWTSSVPGGLQLEDIEVFSGSSGNVSTFHHRYAEDGRRETKLTELAPPISPKNFSEKKDEFNVVMLAPIWNELTPEAVTWFPNAHIGLTPQGWFRRRRDDDSVFYTKSHWERLPRKIQLIVVSEEDLVGDLHAWDWIREHARVAVLTHGKRGHSVCIDGHTQELIPPFIAEEKDPTGAGDVFATTLLLLLANGIEPYDAVQFSSLAASFVVESPGLEGLPSRADLLARYQAVGAKDSAAPTFRYPKSL